MQTNREMGTSEAVPSSFRDRCGFLFNRNGQLYRQVNAAGKEDYDRLMDSGLYQSLVDAGMLVPHHEVSMEPHKPEEAYKVIKPELIPFVSYPYEWCFSQLKDAAITTLRIQRKALEFGMSLKDCSAYNIQFIKGKPVFIDTLSFEKYREGRPWVAYRQFCQHFLSPLALVCYRDARLGQLSRIHLDGIPLDLASQLLPFRTRLNLALLVHIHLHARSQRRFADRRIDAKRHKVSRLGLLGILDNLQSAVERLNWNPAGTQWGEYYQHTNYTQEAFEHKRQTVSSFLDRIRPKDVWDLGANTGEFSQIASQKGIPTISFDMDPATVEKNFRECKRKGETNILPLVLDLTNPSSGIGWDNQERLSLIDRGPARAVLALALVHHLAISNNVPLAKIAGFFARLGDALIVEFVPKDDSQVQRLLSTRDDIFPDYTQPCFEHEFRKHFVVIDSRRIRESKRTLYLMQRKQA